MINQAYLITFLVQQFKLLDQISYSCTLILIYQQIISYFEASVILFQQLMSFASNNSRNVANLLRFQPLQPLPVQQKRVLPGIPNNTGSQAPVSRQRQEIRQEIPVQEAFTPEDIQRQPRKRTPLYQGRGNSRQEDTQVQAMKVRLDQIVRYYQQRHNNLESKIMIRVNELQNFVMKQVPKIDNSTMLASDLVSLKETIKDLRRTQQHQFAEISALKSLSSDRNSADALQQLSKQKEKSTVLFMEVVRLGDTVEKMSQYVNGLGRNYEGKYQDLQNKLANSEKNLHIMSQRTSSGSDVLNELGDKLMSRLTTSQSNLLVLGKQQVKDKEAIAKLMAQNDRLGEDLQLLLKNMQADFQSKLQNRVQETVNRLMMEHQERIRSQQQIRKNLDLRERIIAQKQMSEKMENKAKYDTMDALVRNQLLRKEQSIRSLHKAMQDQFRNILNQLQSQQGKRKQQQAAFRGQIRRVQQSLRKEYDLYKNHQSQLVDKITEMIKTEIQVRLSAQFDLKKLTSSIALEIVNDVNNLKQALSTSNKKLTYAIRQATADSAERAGQLSHYIDSQVKKVVQVVTEKYSKMKSVFTKLAQQLRNHLQNTEQNRKNVEVRLTAIEQDFDKLKNEVNGQIDEFYNDLQMRLKQQKQFVETVVFKKNNDLTVRVSRLQEYSNQYFETLKAGIEDNKDLFNKKISGLSGNESSKSDQQMKRLQNIVFQIKQITEEIKRENQLQFEEIRKDMKDMQSRGKINVQETENKLGLKIGKNVEKQKDLEDQINELSVKLNNLRAQSNPSANSISNDKLRKLQDEFNDLTQRTGDNEQLIQKITSEITVLRAQINTLQQKVK